MLNFVKNSPLPLLKEANRSTKKVKNRHDNYSEKTVDGHDAMMNEDATQSGGLKRQKMMPSILEIRTNDYIRTTKDDGSVKLVFRESIQDKINMHMKRLLVVRVLGRTIGFKTLNDRMGLLWQPKVTMKVMNIDNGEISGSAYDTLAAVTAKANKWNPSKISLVGRATLWKFVLITIPLYIMQTTTIPKGVCNDLDKWDELFLVASWKLWTARNRAVLADEWNRTPLYNCYMSHYRTLPFTGAGVTTALRLLPVALVEDLVVRLLGQPKVEFKQFGWYIDVDEKNKRSFFYYFVEGYGDIDKLPLTLWLNGD
ncbi:hypothetical protein Syun_013931 [Stephania yunnanensis]|uniref:Uncharacterized protein n=1 Tax=Stephania yunnanensis TaxID=152371 RepID=A0AAP0JIC2_9MAGN